MANIFEKVLSVATGGAAGGDYGKGFSFNPAEHATQIRDMFEEAAVLALNYYLPGSGIFTKDLTSKGAQEQLNSDLGKAALLASGGAGYAKSGFGNYDKILGKLGFSGGEAAAASKTGEAAAVAKGGITATDLLTMYAVISATGGSTPQQEGLSGAPKIDNTPSLPDLSLMSTEKTNKRGRAASIKTDQGMALGGAINRKMLVGL